MKAFIVLMLMAASAFAIQLEWDAVTTYVGGSPASNLTYRVHLGQSSRGYATNFTTTNTLYEIAKTNLFPGTNFFAVSAFDLYGQESEQSDEVFYVNSTNRPTQVKGVRLRKLFVQSAPTPKGKWGQDVEITQIETAYGAEFYRLRIGPPIPSSGNTKMFLSAPAPKGARTQPSRVMAPPPMPQK